MTAGSISWRRSQQFAMVPRACLLAIMATAREVRGVNGGTAVAVFTALAMEATPDGRSATSLADAAALLEMNEGAVRRVVTAVLEPAGVVTRTPGGGLLLEVPDVPEAAPGGAPEPREVARQVATPARGGARKRATSRGAPLYTDTPDKDSVATPPVQPRLVAVGGATAPPEEWTPRGLCELLADTIEGRGSKRPVITASWEQEMERLIRLDGRPMDQVATMIRWLDAGACETSAFWRTNVRCPRTLRLRWDTIRERREAERRRDARRSAGGAAATTARQWESTREAMSAGRFDHLEFG